MSARIWALAMVVLALPTAGLAKPRPEEVQAQELNEQARQAFAAKRFDEAADLFLKVYDLLRTPTAVFNAARAREEARRLPEAKALFELFQRIERSPQGQEDAAQHLAAIETQFRTEAEARARAEAQAHAQAEAKARQEAETRARIEAEARKARADAEAAARRADAERQELERLKAEKAKLERPQAPAPLRGLTLLPPSGARDEDTTRTVHELLTVTAADATATRLTPVQSMAAYLAAEQARGAGGPCDMVCQLGVARSLGSAWAVSTSLRDDNGIWRVRQVLWRTSDLADSGALEVSSSQLARLPERLRAVQSQLWNQVRALATTPLAEPSQTPLLVVVTEPAGAAVAVDERDVGPSPVRLPVGPGWHRLRAGKSGWQTEGGLVLMGPGVQQVTLRLRAELPAEPNRLAPTVAAPSVPNVAPPQQARPGTPPPPPRAAAPTLDAPATTKTGATNPAPTVDGQQDSAWKWGVGAAVASGAAIMADQAGDLHGDLSLGIGAHGYWGWSPEQGPAWLALVGGLQWQQFLGLHGGNATPAGMSGTLGLLLPTTNLQVSLRRSWLAVEGDTSFHYDTLGVHLVQAPGWLYMAAGAELLLDSSRVNHTDEFGAGPNVRLTLDLGVNFLGAPMTR